MIDNELINRINMRVIGAILALNELIYTVKKIKIISKFIRISVDKDIFDHIRIFDIMIF